MSMRNPESLKRKAEALNRIALRGHLAKDDVSFARDVRAILWRLVNGAPLDLDIRWPPSKVSASPSPDLP